MDFLALVCGLHLRLISFILLQTFEKWKSDVITLERIMLRSFGFILHVEHPHKFVLNYLVVLEQQEDPESGLLQRAWNLANDRYASGWHAHIML